MLVVRPPLAEQRLACVALEEKNTVHAETSHYYERGDKPTKRHISFFC